MELHERIKELRKNYLHLSQTEFGEKVGVSRSVINNIERNVLARPDQKLSLMKLICTKFNVNEEWLLNGTEPMFAQPDTFSLDSFIREKGATELELEILKAYFDLDIDIRRKAIDYFKEKISHSDNSIRIENNTEESITDPLKDAETSYIKRLSTSAPKTTSSASNITSGENKVSNQ